MASSVESRAPKHVVPLKSGSVCMRVSRWFLGFTLTIGATVLANAQTSFAFSGYSAGSGDAASSVISGDFNRDGMTDFAVTSRADGVASVYLNSGSNHFSLKSEFAVGGPQEIRTADINHDGKLDLLVSDWQQPRIETFLGNGDGTFVPGSPITLS